MNGFANSPQPDFGALLDGRDIAHVQRRAILRLEDNLANVVHGSNQTHFANIYLLQADLYKVAAGIAVIARELTLYLIEAETVGHELIGIDLNLILLRGPAEA